MAATKGGRMQLTLAANFDSSTVFLSFFTPSLSVSQLLARKLGNVLAKANTTKCTFLYLSFVPEAC